MFIEAEPKAFGPCSGAWGRRGATGVKLGAVKKTTLRRAMAAAWELAAPKRLTEKMEKGKWKREKRHLHREILRVGEERQPSEWPRFPTQKEQIPRAGKNRQPSE